MAQSYFSGIRNIIGRSAGRKLVFFTSARALTNVLDLLGIAGIALLASIFGAFAGGKQSSVDLPFLGKVAVGEIEAIIIALFVVILFISKSGLAILLHLKTSMFVAGLESRLSDVLAREYFGVGQGLIDKKATVSNFQAMAMTSTAGIKAYINARVLFFSEGSLLASLLLLFLVINPLATLGLAAFMLTILYLLNQVISSNLGRQGREQVSGSQVSLQASRDLHGIKREAHAAGALDPWLQRFSLGRSRLANAQAISYTLNSLPRYVIETSLILGMFVFMAGIVLFSDIASQSVTIGVFLGGGLRIMASVIPFQSAVLAMRTGQATGQLAFDELEKIADRPMESDDVRQSDHLENGQLRFSDVYFSYEAGSEPVLRGVSFEAQPNTKIAIVGPSGAGKSTIFDLAMGFKSPDAGQVFVGHRTSMDVLINNPGFFAIVPQRPHLVEGSLLENVSLLPAKDTELERAKDALIQSGLERLTQKANWHSEIINPDLGELSGGEVQKLSLARAVYRKPKILFLDEATSSLDAENESAITRIIEKLRETMTVILIAHRLSTVKGADKIIYLDHGRIVAEGTFSELKSQVKDFAKAIEIMDLG